MPKHKKILLVEDHIAIQIFHKVLLNKLGYEVDVADTGQSALTLFVDHQYCAIFMDIGLPDISGVDLMRKIRSLETANQKPVTPMIVMTAYSVLDIKQQCQRKGIKVDEFLNKPVKIEQLREVLAVYTGMDTIQPPTSREY